MGFFYGEKYAGFRRCFSIFLTFALILTMLPFDPAPVSAEGKSPLKWGKKKEKKELLDKRTATTKLFDNGDGTYTKEIYFSPVHKKAGKQWKEISTKTKRAGDKVKPESTELDVQFEATSKDGKYATVQSGEHRVAYTFVGAAGKDADGKEKEEKARDSQAVHQAAEVTYKHVVPDVHLRNKIFNKKVKEDIVLEKYTGVNEFRFRLDTKLEAKEQKDGSIHLVDKKGDTVFVLGKPFMEDSNIDPKSDEPAQSDEVEVELKREKDHYLLTVKADEEWLKDEKRKYPVYIDPSTSLQTVGDTYVSDKYTTTNYGSDTELKVGYYDTTTGTNYSYLKQDISGLRGMIIDSATLNVHVLHSYYNPPTKTGLWLDVVNKDWTESGLTWSYQQQNGITSTNIGKLDVAEGQIAAFNVKSTVQAWADGTKGNYGFKFHTNGNGQTYWKKLSSSESATNKPYLSVTYHAPTANLPTALAYSNWAGSANGFVDLRWEPVQGATEYYLWIYNGKEYQKLNVGNTTYYSTSGKKLWPTEEEIAAGRYELHINPTTLKEDGGGTDLAKDPTPVYRNAGNTTATGEYVFRLSAKTLAGETPQTADVKIAIPDRTEDLGTEEFWAFNEVPGGDVNLVTGNLVISETDLELPGREPEMSIERTYNSRSKATGPFGKGWTFNYGMRVEEDSKGNIVVHDMDGGNHYFQKQVDGTYSAPLGVKLTLKGSKATGWTITDKDQTVYTFDTEGKLTQIEDANKNKLTLTYNDLKQLVKITDPSNREFNLTYTNGRITQISGPDNRVWKYNYNFERDFLISVTDETQSITRYGYYYDGGLENKLAVVIEPGEMETWYEYDYQGKLFKVNDPEESYTYIGYDPINKMTKVEDPNINETYYYYNDAGNLIKEVEDPNGLNLVTTYTWDHNNLTRVCDPEANKNQTCATAPTELYEYDTNGNLTKAQDATGTETFKYNQNNDVVEYKDPNGETFKTLYDAKGNEISEVDPDKVSEAQVTDGKGNVTETTDELGVGENLVINPGLERVVSGAPEAWTVQKVNDSGSVASDSTVYYSGTQSVKITTKSTSASLGFAGATQELYVAPNTTYTLSAMIKSQGLTQAGAFLNVLQLKEDGTYSSGGWKDNRFSRVSGTQDWTQRQVTFTTAADTVKVRIYLEVDHSSLQGVGTAWFDEVMLEAGDVSTDYNPIENSSFEEGLAYWRTSAGTGSVDTANAFDGAQSLKMARSSATETGIQYVQYIPLNQSTPEPITVTGLSKASNVTNTETKDPNGDYSIWVDAIQEDNTYVTDQAKFALGTHDWQRAAVTINPTKKLKEVRVYVLFRGNNTGTVWFDNIRVKKGSAVEKYEYDASGNNITKVTDPSGKSEEIAYDAYGNETSIKDAKGLTTQYTYDKSNQLKTVTLPGNTLKVHYTHDESGNVIEKKVTSADGQTVYNTISYEYDNDKMTSVTDELGNTTHYEYDGEGDVNVITNPNGSTVKHIEADDGTYVGIHYNDTELYRIHYDDKGNEKQIDNVKLGTSKTHTFDASDRLVQQIQGNNTLKWTYDPNDQLIKQEAQIGSQLITHNYAYNDSENNIQVSDHTGKVYRFDYDEKGNVRTAVYANGVGTSGSYDDNNQVTEVVIGTKEGTPIAKYKYAYDANGNRTSIVDKDGKELKFTYDVLDQLTSETDPVTGNTIHYTYDPLGNRTKKEVKDSAGNVVSSTSYTYNVGNQLTQVDGTAYAYDKNGNRLEDGKHTYVWDAGDRLVEVKDKATGTTIATYDYDEDGRRVRSTVGGKVTNYYYDGETNRVLYETDGNNALTRYYTYNEDGQLLSMTKASGETYYYQTNAHGDVVAVTDQQGTVVASYVYDAWGNILSKTGAFADENPYRYAGYRYDTETGLYYLMARYYQPVEGVFLSMDPDPGDEDDPQSQNVYTYANNNPLRYTDPDGHWINLAIGIVSGIYRGYKTYKKTGSLKKAVWAGAKQAVMDAVPIGRVFKALKYGAKAYKAYKSYKYAKKYTKRIPKKATKKKYKKYYSASKAKKANQRRYGAGKKVKSTKKVTTKRKVSRKQSKYTSNRSKGNRKYQNSSGTRKVKKGQKQVTRKQHTTKKAPKANKIKREQVRQQKEQQKWQQCTASTIVATMAATSTDMKQCKASDIFETRDLSKELKEELESIMIDYSETILNQFTEEAIGLRVNLPNKEATGGNVAIAEVLITISGADGDVPLLNKDGKTRWKSHSGIGNPIDKNPRYFPGWEDMPTPSTDPNKPYGPYALKYMNDFMLKLQDGEVPNPHDRRKDSEFKILEPIARQILEQKAAGKTVKGKITLFSERPLCFSCQGVVSQFREMFPEVELEIYSNKIKLNDDEDPSFIDEVRKRRKNR
ncbi:DNRLRE domain-containing protein [Laceyella putida]|uniref:DNRLRE domain-containing protein n=1 Tax=Laceyella putida TaxID=110101 RepID=A0ABW2RJP7_9BACL